MKPKCPKCKSNKFVARASKLAYDPKDKVYFCSSLDTNCCHYFQVFEGYLDKIHIEKNKHYQHLEGNI